MQKFCPRCGSSVQETMKFCKNCGAALNNEEYPEAISDEDKTVALKKAGRKKHYLFVATIVAILLIAALGYLFSQNSLSIKSDPMGAGVYLNSEFRGVTPTVIYNLLPGEYQLELRHDGYPPGKRILLPISVRQRPSMLTYLITLFRK